MLSTAEKSTMRGYIVIALLTGARTEELRALTWDHVDLEGDPSASPPVPPNVKVWRSVRTGGDTKTRKSRRSLALSSACDRRIDGAPGGSGRGAPSRRQTMA